MLFDQAISEVQQIVGWRSDKSAEIQAALTYAQNQREQPGRTHPWFMTATEPIATVVEQVTYNLPTGFIQPVDEKEGEMFFYLGTTLQSRVVFLKRLMNKDAQEVYLGGLGSADETEPVTATGKPTHYVLNDTTFDLWPRADAVYSVTARYVKRQTALTLGQENSWLANAPWILIGEAALKLGADLRDAEAVSEAREILQRAEADLFRATIHRKNINRRRSMGSKL